METLLFSRSDVAAHLTMTGCIDAVERAFRMLGQGEVPAPATMAMHARGGAFHTKAGLMPAGTREYFAVKTNGNFPGNPARGLPTIQGLIMLCDATDGRVLAVLDSIEITAMRTAAATAVAARHLARPASSAVAIVGCGMQAPAQLSAVREVLPVKDVFVYDVDAAARSRCSHAVAGDSSTRVHEVESLEAALARADVVVTCTTSKEFLVHAGMVQPGTFVAGVGVDNEHKRELAPDLLAASTVVTDLRTQCALIGDLHHAIDAGMMGVADVHADLADVVAGERPGRTSADEIIVFDSTGIALEDVAAAVAIYESATGLSTGSAVRRIAFNH